MILLNIENLWSFRVNWHWILVDPGMYNILAFANLLTVALPRQWWAPARLREIDEMRCLVEFECTWKVWIMFCTCSMYVWDTFSLHNSVWVIWLSWAHSSAFCTLGPAIYPMFWLFHIVSHFFYFQLTLIVFNLI